ncbi:MAG: hypothetical protein DA408_02195 [Bacteroidetes bacterium]|nr:MAG: hypothetical protein C7N36_00880 [Bacteroidota bacterium]PTM14624.1 MAG: hypothetical protein DA408_02195 [Bacteroidota bacterium]
MDRRSLLAGRFIPRQPATTPFLVTTGLEPYPGPWEFAQAAHLLRRTTFAPTKAMLSAAVNQGLDATILQLFSPLPLPEPPIYFDTGDEPLIPPGAPWIDDPYSSEADLVQPRRRSLQSWTMQLIWQEGISIRENLCLFWHNHFAVDNNVEDPRLHYRYITTIRTQAWGNFRQLVKDITIDPCMLRFLNGNQNDEQSPNENYARELLELYTVGKGAAAGPGDYTTFTEQDVAAMARVLTGWVDTGYLTEDPAEAIGATFVPERHDPGAKQLSPRFNQAVLTDTGEQEYADLIDVIFAQPAVATHICRKLYRHFVYYKINEATEAQVIAPLAQLLIEQDYELEPVLQTLLRSTHFFDVLNLGPMIKHPLQFVVAPIKQTGIPLPEDQEERYHHGHQIYRLIAGMGMAYFDIPEVAGWKAYYQPPLYYRNWINAITLHQRSDVVRRLVTSGYTPGEVPLRMDPLAFLETLDNALEPVSMIAEIVQLLLPLHLELGQLVALKELLIPGLPDFEWTVEYGSYLADPTDDNLRQALASKLEDFFLGLFNMAEFHLS